MKLILTRKRETIEEYVHGIASGDRVMLSKAITLIESQLPADNKLAETLLEKILPGAGKSLRIGITGVPGAGKSTFIEALGKRLTAAGKRVAVLTIDPSSHRTGGSILADKTRMENLANDELAFVRPTAAGTTLGGVHSKTRETMLLCEASGFEVMIIETVGVGQSETHVKNMVDFFLLVTIAGAGDEMQGMKRGIMEMADAIVINKADGDNLIAASVAQTEYQTALHMFHAKENGWQPKVLTCSSISQTGIKEVWEIIMSFENTMKQNGDFFINRQKQNLQWMYDIINHQLQNKFYKNEKVKQTITALGQQVEEGSMPAITAARRLLGEV